LNPWNWWVPLTGIFAFAIVAPPWWFFVRTQLTGLPIHWQFLGTFMMPAFAGLFIASWLEPE